MKTKIWILGLLALSYLVGAQVLTHVDQNAIFYIGENALVYNGGGAQSKGNGRYDIHGNMMVVGSGSDVLKTLDATGGNKTDGGNIILRLNDPANHSSADNPSTYGQLYINGLSQNSITAVVDKEYRTASNGTYQQIALPFFQKQISSLSGSANSIGTFGKTFTNARWSKNEVLTWNNAIAVSDNLSIWANTQKNTTYYMFGALNFDSGNPPASMPTISPTPTGAVYTIKGVPFANGISEPLQNAALGINFGIGGNNRNKYNEKYNTYLQDNWDEQVNPSNPWSVPTFGRNIYQFGNPYFTNLDLGFIGLVESAAITDNNAISAIQGIRYDPGSVVTLPTGSTYSIAAKFVNFTTGVNPAPTGDVGLIIKPMQTFVLKLRNNDAEISGNRTLNFDNLRRFSNIPRLDQTSYSVTASRPGQLVDTVKQLGVIGLDENGKELARAYYVVYPTAITGHTSQPTVQSTLGSSNIMGTFEEDPVNGGYDTNYSNLYWLYINEANETDFFAKAVPLALYNTSIKSLKFEIRENAQLLPDGAKDLSTGIGFHYKAANGDILDIAQNQIIPVTTDQYSLYYGKSTTVLDTEGAAKPSRTMVAYNQMIDSFFLRFDPDWKKADVKVFDMSGKLVLSQDGVAANRDFVLDIPRVSASYIVTAVSDKGEKISAKIIR
ncbi:T9SS type A sorting domain-containing protein [Chryseobacterium suipulveris]|uniref:T9SS type A sorting domain-containing protein n=1 Tax=Chryseobacterium suipulveris TaxID=2929800 RepID=A0ABY4BP31_9FLAO|nr:T9SS type A sorting domain-containing protein [Chryseobacterium suipulveris]UOE40529.1 T9SS type A sorting domain-containing protein [Chryseobacterium suipulveris]